MAAVDRRRWRGPARRWRLLRLRRHPTAYWAAVGVCAALTALVIGTLVTRADAARRRWGDAEPVVVATRGIEPGQAIGPGDVDVTHWPVALIPRGSLREVPEGQVVTVPLGVGEPVLSHHLGGSGSGGLAARLPPDSRGIAVPVGPAALALSPGDLVDVLATVDPSVSGGEDPTFAVAHGALVVDVREDTATIAVSVDDVPRVAFAVAHGIVTLALVPAG